MFSVTGFLTFSVVAATSLANIMSNINNNNNNNNDNNNNDNQNDNNQVSTNKMEGRRRKRSRKALTNPLHICKSIYSGNLENSPNWYLEKTIKRLSKRLHFCPEQYICNAAVESNFLDSNISKQISLFVTTISAFILSDIFPNFKPEVAVQIIGNVTEPFHCSNMYCSEF